MYLLYQYIELTLWSIVPTAPRAKKSPRQDDYEVSGSYHLQLLC